MSSTEDDGDHPNLFPSLCQPEINKLTYIVPAKMGLFEQGNYNLESETMASHMQDPSQQGKENIFIVGKRKLEGKGSVALHWLNPCQGREVFLLLSSSVGTGLGIPPFWSPDTL